MNIWRQLRTAGFLVIIVDVFINNPYLLIFGAGLVFIGIANGVASLEDRVTELENKDAIRKD